MRKHNFSSFLSAIILTLVGMLGLMALWPVSSSGETLPAAKWIGINEFRGGISLRWFRVQNATSYAVLKKTGEGGQYVELVRVTNPSYDDFLVQPGQVYFYKIIPYDRNQQAGTISEERFYKLAPPEPEILVPPVWSAHQVRDDGIALSWIHGTPENVLAYNLYRKKKGESSFKLMFSAIDTNFLDRRLKKGETYQYAVTALDKKLQESDFSNVLSVKNVVASKAGPVDKRIAGIKTLEQVVNRTELLATYSWEKYGFISPVDVEYSPASDRLLVADSGTGLITIIDDAGDVVTTLGGRGQAPWEFDRLMGITLDSEGYIYAVDAYEGDIVVFNPRLTFENRVALIDEVTEYFGEDLMEKYPWFRFGLTDVDIDTSGNLLIVDNPDSWIYVLDEKDHLVKVIGQRGYATGSLQYPTYIETDDDGRVYVSDSLNSRVQVFDGKGVPMGIIGERGLGIGQFIRPKGLALDSSGFLYVADSGLNVIQVFNPEGEFAALLGDERGLPIDLGSPNGLIFVPPDRLIIAEKMARRIQVRRVVLDRHLPLLAKDLARAGSRPAAPGTVPGARTREKVAPSPFSAQIEKLRLLSERGGLAAFGAPLFERGTAVPRKGAEDIFTTIAALAVKPHIKISLQVTASVKGSGEASSSLAAGRIAAIKGAIGSAADLIRFTAIGKQGPTGSSDRIEVTVERSP